jgi:hypothetical protein
MYGQIPADAPCSLPQSMILMPEIGKCYSIYGESLAEVAIWGVNISGSLLPQMLPVVATWGIRS